MSGQPWLCLPVLSCILIGTDMPVLPVWEYAAVLNAD